VGFNPTPAPVFDTDSIAEYVFSRTKWDALIGSAFIGEDPRLRFHGPKDN